MKKAVGKTIRRSTAYESGIPLRAFIRSIAYPLWLVVCIVFENAIERLFALPTNVAALESQLADQAISGGLRTRITMSIVVFVFVIVMGIVFLTWVTRNISKSWPPLIFSKLFWAVRWNL